MEDIMKIVKSYEKSGLLMKSANKTIENEEKIKRWVSYHVIKYIKY